MKRFKNIIFGIVLIPHFSKLDCPKYIDITGTHRAMKENIYCTNLDNDKNYTNNKSILSNILQTIDDSKTNELWLSSFDFNEDKIVNSLCKKLEGGNFKLKILLQNSKSVIWLQKLTLCVKNNSKYSYRTIEANKNGISNFHAKLIFVNPTAKGDSKIFFSSNNLTSGTYLKHENMIEIQVDKESPFLKKHICAFEKLEDNISSLDSLAKELRACDSFIIDKKNNPKLFLVPGEGEAFLKSLAKNIMNAKEVTVATHRFTLRPLIFTLKKFLKRGGKLNFYADGGYFESFFHQNSYQTEFEFLTLLELYGLGAKIIPIYTNQPHGSFFHHKFLLMDQIYSKEEPILYIGSANFTNTAIQTKRFDRGNSRFGKRVFKTQNRRNVSIENLYEIKNRKLYNSFLQYLEPFKSTSLTSHIKAPPIWVR
jgi:hypothetical protein